MLCGYLCCRAEYLVAAAIFEENQTAPQKEVIRKYELGASAYAELLLSMKIDSPSGRVAWAIVDQAKDSDHPDGNPKLAFDNFIKKYLGKTAPNYIKI